MSRTNMVLWAGHVPSQARPLLCHCVELGLQNLSQQVHVLVYMMTLNMTLKLKLLKFALFTIMSECECIMI